MPKATAKSPARKHPTRVDSVASGQKRKPARASGAGAGAGAKVSATAKRHGPSRTKGSEIAALDRAVTLLLAVAETVEPTPLHRAAQRTGLSKATAFRILSTLATEELVSQDEVTSSYRLGVMPLRLANALLDGIPVRAAARPAMRTLSESLNETVVLSVRDGDTRVNIDAVECSNAISTARRFGEPRPLDAGAASRVLLAGMTDAEIDAWFARVATAQPGAAGVRDRGKLKTVLATIRRQGYDSTMAEVSLDAHAVAAAIHVPDGGAIAALHIAIPRTRFTPKVERICTRALKAAVAEIERAIALAPR